MQRGKRTLETATIPDDSEPLDRKKHKQADQLDFLHISNECKTDAIYNHYQSEFRRIAHGLLNGAWILSIKSLDGVMHQYKIVEIEFYLRHLPQHIDPFSHARESQLEFGKFCFHKRGNSYAGGTWKGLDISFGCSGDPDTPAIDNGPRGIMRTNAFHAGILIRSIMNIETNEVVEGPCKCVDKILKILKAKDVADLVSNILDDDLSITNNTSSLYLSKSTIPVVTNEIFETPRIGLYIRKTHKDLKERLGYVTRLYRFHTQTLSKGKAHTIIGILLPNKQKAVKTVIDDIVEKTGISKKLVSECLEAFAKGSKMPYTKFIDMDKGSSQNICQYFGSLYPHCKC
ncbi:hypothetical protein SmJEL517_g03697 [Synchytrium microbalum]|uniref:Uncharacterized protein n=1 Tax=Synchytrium microbalum TaxID=1806994 RepID=A0A507BV90_9FUNG|nr:uncharacterized protein SmJEL517_g03697 [Synchytrium microbalum]TPX33330.1 hypothetical protein SmJEL517_g03697 [Synchytrium microbalum]